MGDEVGSDWPGEWLAGYVERVVTDARVKGLPARAIGGMGAYLATKSLREAPLQRRYRDFDLIVPGGRGRVIQDIMEAAGYEGKRQFNALHGSQRQIFVERDGRFTVDILVGTFSMCHKIDHSEAFSSATAFAPRHLLLLTKLQIVQIERKDLNDACALLLDWGRADFADEFLDAASAARHLARDWGLHHTVQRNLERLSAHLGTLLPERDAQCVETAIARLQNTISRTPKSTGWRVRARIGERVRWYELPEEV